MGDNIIRVFASLDIPLRYNDGSYRPLEDILEELSNHWDKLSNYQQDFIGNIVKEIKK